ncbi:hypothetical protein D3C76_1248700 [compost metagenome]
MSTGKRFAFFCARSGDIFQAVLQIVSRQGLAYLPGEGAFFFRPLWRAIVL